eukprot:UN01477
MSLLRCILGALFFGLISVITAGLCNWQLNRRIWKAALMDEREQSLTQDPVDLASLTASATDIFSGLTEEERAALLERLSDANVSFENVMEALDELKKELAFHNVYVDGRFDYGRELLLGPTVPPLENGQFNKVEMNKGYFVITPFNLYEPLRVEMPVKNDNGEVAATIPVVMHDMLVNRGWIPAGLIKTYLANPLLEHEMLSPEEMTMMANIIHQQHDVNDPPDATQLRQLLEQTRISPPQGINVYCWTSWC